MPFRSKAQERLMQARAHGWKPKNPRGDLPSASVAKKFVEDSKDQRIDRLPERVRKCDGGMTRKNW